jgi:hypothetical protein
MSTVTIENLDGETFEIVEGEYQTIQLGDDTIALPLVKKINDEPVLYTKIMECNVAKRVADENNPYSIGNYIGTITVFYYVDKSVSYFEGATLDPEILKQKIRNYYVVPFYIAFDAMFNESDVLFDDTCQSISELIKEAKTKEN